MADLDLYVTYYVCHKAYKDLMRDLRGDNMTEDKTIRRIIWIVLDSVGCGQAPDAAKFGDEGSDTLGNTAAAVGGLNIPNLISLGLGNIDGIKNLDKCDSPLGAYGKLAEMSQGKDTTIGHWEMAGIYTPKPFPTYPDGFPDKIIDEFLEKTGLAGILCNKPASGTVVINELGDEHVRTGKPIIYTSGDSVFQIAAHEDVIPVDELYRICHIARQILVGDHAVARVIARPFIGQGNGSYKRTANRRDFSLKPSEDNILVRIKDAGLPVIGVGKIEDIFAGVGITEARHTKDNMDGCDVTLEYMAKVEEGLIYTNLVEFDSTWGHRNDYQGYAKGLEDFDKRLKSIMEEMREDDMLIITADHGCDPTTPSTDHSREFVPLLFYGPRLKRGVNLHTSNTYADIAQTLAEMWGLKPTSVGKSRVAEIFD